MVDTDVAASCKTEQLDEAHRFDAALNIGPELLQGGQGIDHMASHLFEEFLGTRFEYTIDALEEDISVLLLEVFRDIVEDQLKRLVGIFDEFEEHAKQMRKAVVGVPFGELWEVSGHGFKVFVIAVDEQAVKSDNVLDDLLVDVLAMKLQHLRQYRVHFQLLQQELADSKQLQIFGS